MTFGADSIDAPRDGGEQRSAALYDIFRKAPNVDSTYVCDDIFMAYFRPAKRGFRARCAPLLARYRGVSSVELRAVGNRLKKAIELKTNMVAYSELVREADVIQFEHPFAFPFLREQLDGKVVIYSSHNVEAFVVEGYFKRAQASASELRRLRSRWAAVEHELVVRADLVIACTERDAEHYRRLGAQNVCVAANGANAPFVCEDSVPLDLPFSDYAAFVSSSWNPNAVSLIHFGAELKLPKGQGLVCIGSIGESTFPGFEKLIENESIYFSGSVPRDRMESMVSGARLLVVPMLEASGSNIKTAQALLTDKLVLATGEAFRGFESFIDSDGVEIFSTAKEFQERIGKRLEEGATRFCRPEAEALRWSNALRPAERAIFSVLSRLEDLPDTDPAILRDP